MTMHPHNQRALASLALAASTLTLYACTHPPDRANATPSSRPAAVTTPTTTHVAIPPALAATIRQARTTTAATCTPHKAVGWAAIDETGTVQGTYAACTSGP